MYRPMWLSSFEKSCVRALNMGYIGLRKKRRSESLGASLKILAGSGEKQALSVNNCYRRLTNRRRDTKSGIAATGGLPTCKQPLCLLPLHFWDNLKRSGYHSASLQAGKKVRLAAIFFGRKACFAASPVGKRARLPNPMSTGSE